MVDPKSVCLHHSGIEKLIEKLCMKIEGLEKLIDVRLNAIEKALEVAQEEMDSRLEAMNEFRSQLTSQASTFISKESVDLKIEKLDTRIDSITHLKDLETGSMKWRDHILTVLISCAVLLIGHYIFKF